MSTQQQYQELEQEEFLLGPINGVLGGLPVAEQNQDYFLVFKGVGGTGPEIIDNTAYFIQYVIDSDGNVSKPSQGSIARLNTIQNFPTGKTTTVRIDNASGINTQLDGDHVITGLGIQQPILYTQFGIPSSSYTTDISFTIPGGAPSGSYGVIPDFRGLMTITSSTSATTGNVTTYSASGSSPDVGAATLNLSAGTYTVNSSSSLQSITFNPTIGFTNTNSEEARSIKWGITKNGSTTPIIETSLNLPAGESGIASEISYTEPLSNLGGNPVYRLRITLGDNFIDKDFVQFNVSSQNPSPTDNTNASSGLWTTGSSTSTWLTASTYLSQNYGNTQDTSNFQGTGGSFGLSPIKTPFLLSPGDRIRFEYNPQKDFIIYEVIEPRAASDALLKIKLSSTVPSNTILDNFVLHRVDNNSIKYIILDIAKDPTVDNPENPFTGIILPKYPSEKLKNNLENILSKLKQEGIIEN
jgi:hypothetical protein